MYSTSELDELFQILNSVKGFKLNNHTGATQQSEQVLCTQHTSCSTPQFTHTSGYRLQAREGSSELQLTEDGNFQHEGTSIL